MDDSGIDLLISDIRFLIVVGDKQIFPALIQDKERDKLGEATQV